MINSIKKKKKKKRKTLCRGGSNSRSLRATLSESGNRWKGVGQEVLGETKEWGVDFIKRPLSLKTRGGLGVRKASCLKTDCPMSGNLEKGRA